MSRHATLILPMAVLLAVSSAPAQKAGQDNRKGNAAPAAKWTLQAVRVEKLDRELHLFNEGTTVTVKLEIPGSHLLAFDAAASKIDVFADNRKTELLKPPSKELPWDAIREPTLNRPSGDQLRADFRAQLTPVRGATSVRVKGTVAVLVGKDEKQVKLADAKFGKFTQENIFGLRLIYRGEHPIKGGVAEDADGKDIEFTASNLGRSPGADGKQEFRGSLSLTSKLAARIKTDTIRVTYFDTVEKIMVPVDLEVGPGL